MSTVFASHISFFLVFFFFNDTATTEIYTLSLHDALPISPPNAWWSSAPSTCRCNPCRDRKSTRLNSSHANISYAVFCLENTSELQSLQYIVCRLLLESHRWCQRTRS